MDLLRDYGQSNNTHVLLIIAQIIDHERFERRRNEAVLNAESWANKTRAYFLCTCQNRMQKHKTCKQQK